MHSSAVPFVDRILVPPGSIVILFIHVIHASKKRIGVVYITRTQGIYQLLETDMIKWKRHAIN